MAKYRIVPEAIEGFSTNEIIYYYVEKKHWFWGWSYIVSHGPKKNFSFKSVEEAKQWIDEEGWKNRNEIVYYDGSEK